MLRLVLALSLGCLVGCASESKKSEGIYESGIRSAIKNKEGELNACYNSQLRKNPEMQGAFELKFDIQASGNASNITVVPETNSLKNKNVEACFIKQISQMKFPTTPDGRTIEVKYPFKFSFD